MIKRILEFSTLGLLILAGCAPRPVQEQADSSLPLSNSPPIDLNAALVRAKSENKLVVLDFTGTDWCGPCIQLREEVFAQPEFQSYAGSNLVFLAVDFPAKYRLSNEANATNDFLAAKFRVSGFPTVIALDGNGKKLWQQDGYDPGDSPGKWIATLDSLKSHSK
jgi:protein disulfide-isomerase